MKRIIKLTESDLTRIVRRIINEENNMTPKDWEDIWFDLRRISKSFAFPEPDSNVFGFGGLEFHMSDDGDYLELNDFYRDPYNWKDDYQEGADVIENYAEKLGRIIFDSGLDLEFEMKPNFKMRIYKR